MEVREEESELFRERLILASALLHASPPTDRIHANCDRVLRHAMFAAGVWDDRCRSGGAAALQGFYDGHPLVWVWYSTLIRLTRQEPAMERLLEGAGNLSLPAGAAFTACWLTPRGRVLAEQFLIEHPEMKQKLSKRP